MCKIFSIFLSLCFLYCFVFVETITAFTLPLNIETFNLTAGKINDYFLTESKNPQVIFIQDLHTSSSVQKNISKIIEEISKTYSVDKVLIEGLPYQKTDTSFLQNLKQFNITDNLLESGLLSAIEYYLLTNNKNIEIYGLENWQQYLNNIEKAASILRNKTYKAKLYKNFRTALYKKIPYSKTLLKYVNFNLTDLKLISKMNQPILQFDSLQRYYHLTKNYNQINLKQVKKEQKQFLELLKTKINFAQYNELINSYSERNSGKYNKLLYSYLQNDKQLQSKYNNLYQYLNNTIAIKELNTLSLLEQKNKYFESFINDNYINKKTKQDLFILKMTELFEDFLNLAITEQDYNFFKIHYERYLILVSKYLSDDFGKYSTLFYTIDIFNYHDNNINRNKIFVDNILNSLNQNNLKTNIVIAGGFHTDVLNELKKHNISYLLITPSVENDKDNKFYNKVIESTYKFNKQALAKISLMLTGTSNVPSKTTFLYLTEIIKILAEENYSVGNIGSIVPKLSGENISVSCKYSDDKFILYCNGKSTDFDIKDGNVIMDGIDNTVNPKQIVITSDIHAGYSRWLQLFVYQLEPQLQNKEYSNLKELYDELIKIYPEYKTDNIQTETQIERAMEDIVINILKQKEDTSFYILGDLLDRGDKPVETFNFIKRIFETGKAEFVTGNHDLYAFMNLLGLHLPFYKNYKGIPDDYEVTVTISGKKKPINIQKLLQNKRDLKDKNDNSKIYWAGVLSDYMKYADDRQQSIWNNKETEFQKLFTNTFASEFENDKTVDMLHNPTGIFGQDEILLNFHKKFFGRNVGSTVYTGIRAVDKMSINWWLERKQELDILSNKYPQYQEYWYQLNNLIDTIVSEQQQMIDKQYNDGNWQWVVVDSIMFGNYKTTCWNGLDWAYHAKWGSQDRGFIGYRDKQLKAENKEGINNVSYLEDSLFMEMAEFYKNNFYMYKIDDNGICYMHSVLPVDEDSDVAIGYVDSEGNFHTGIKGFIYKGIHYEGINLLKGFDVMTEDIRNYDISSNNLSEIYEALTIITSIYADNTTQIKPANVKEMKEAGFAQIFSKIGLGTVVAGHNPIEKLKKQNINQIEYKTVKILGIKVKIPILINVDKSMSKGYKNQGLARTVNNKGISTLYFEDGNTYNISKTEDVDSFDFTISKLYNTVLIPLLKNYAENINNTQKINKRNSLIILPLQVSENFENLKDIDGIEQLDKLHTQNVSTAGLVISDKKFDTNLFETSTLIDKTTIKLTDKDIPVNIYLNKIDVAKGTVDVIWVEYDSKNIEDKNIENIIKQELMNKLIKSNINYKLSSYKNILLADNSNLFEQIKPADISSNLIETLYDTFGFIPPLVYIDRLNIIDDTNKETSTQIIIDMLSAA